MKAEELRIGNLVEYYITDNTDERKEWWEVTKIDVHDLESLSQTNDPDYRPIPLTEDWLLSAGFERDRTLSGISFHNFRFNDIELCAPDKEGWCAAYCSYDIFKLSIKYVHQLQNFYFAITGNELTFSDNHNPCTSDDPDDMCKNCTCWKATRKNCS